MTFKSITAGFSVSTMAAAAAAAFAVAAAPSAHAQDADATRTVRYADLDLSRTGDAMAMMRRIRSTAITVCLNATASPDGAASQRAFGPCVDETVHATIDRIGAPALTTAYLGKGRQTELARR